jgi:hypothetical protein
VPAQPNDTSSAPVRPGLSLADLVHEAETNPPKPILEGLIHENEIVGLHGTQEVFKTLFCLLLAEALATGGDFLGTWKVSRLHAVFFLETEMSVSALGKRAQSVYGQNLSQNIFFADENQLRQFRRASTLTAKLNLLRDWLLQLKKAGTEIDVVIIDTANPLFRGRQSPNDETTAGEFFDRIAELPAKLKIFVRHNRKRRADNDVLGGFGDEEDAQSQRGSGQFADVPDLLVQLRRPDKRVDKAKLEITKFRHGSKPAPFDLWFDHLDFRLIPYPPVVHLLRLGPATRDELITGLKARFNIGHNAAETQLKSAKEARLVVEAQKGHRKLLSIDWNAAPRQPDEGDYLV